MKNLMNQTFPILFLLSALVSSCGNLTFTPTATLSPAKTPTYIPATFSPALSLVDSAETVNILPNEGIEDIYRYSGLISPDGAKVALANTNMYYHEQDSFVLSVISLNDPSMRNELTIQLDRPSTIYIFKSWSPDGTAFVGTYYDAKKFNGSETCCGEAIAITKIVDGKVQTSIYSWGWNNLNNILWSNDSSMLSVTFSTDEYNTLIIDRDGKLVKTLKTGEKAVFWSENIFYYTTKKGDKVELRTLDLNTEASSLMLENFDGIYYVAQNKKEILLTVPIPNRDDIYSSTRKFYIFDISTKKIKEITTSIPNTLWVYPWVSSLSQEHVALRASFKQDENTLWIFDWKTHKFKEYGQIQDLFCWNENNNGFLVTSLEGKQKIIKP